MSKSKDLRLDIDELYSLARKVVSFRRFHGHPATVLAKTELRLADAHRRGMVQYLRSWLQEAARSLRAVSASRVHEFVQHLTPDESKLFRSVCAVDRRVVTRVLTRGRINNEREFEALRAWVEEIEGQQPEHDQLARAYELLEQFELRSDG